jgi:hypothetical protein
VLTPKILIAQYLFSSSYYINSFFFFHFLSLFHAILTSPPHSSCKSFLRSKEWGGISLEYFFLAIARASERVLSFTWKERVRMPRQFFFFFGALLPFFHFYSWISKKSNLNLEYYIYVHI